MQEGQNVRLVLAPLSLTNVIYNHVSDFLHAVLSLQKILSEGGSGDFRQMLMLRQHAVNTAAALFRRSDRRRRSSGRPFVCDDLLEALDTVLGEGRDAILADAVDAQAAVFGEHVDREFV